MVYGSVLRRTMEQRYEGIWSSFTKVNCSSVTKVYFPALAQRYERYGTSLCSVTMEAVTFSEQNVA